MIRIPQNRLDRGFEANSARYEEAALRVLRSGYYILGPEVAAFEKEYAEYLDVPYCVGLANGLDALTIGCRIMGVGPGDEVIVQGNTYIASVMGISINGATPVFCEPDEFFQIDADRIEALITEKTKAIMVVHLYGHVADMDKVTAICKKHNLKLIEDCAQAHGATWKGKKVGTFGDVGAFSFYPSKNLGAFGDAGALVCHDEKLNRDARVIRNYGSEKRYYNETVGMNSRLDELQAAMLRERLREMEDITAERERLAETYLCGIKNPLITLPAIRDNTRPVWHQFVVKTTKRDELMTYLAEKEIGSLIHYPIPPHLSEAYAYLGHKKGEYPVTEEYASTVLSLPLYNGMTKEEQEEVILAINQFEG